MAPKRKEKIAKELKRELSQIILYELKDPRIGFVTIIRVEPAGDLKSARVFVSILANETARDKTLDCLTQAKGYIQKIIGERMNLRYTPVLSFFLDKSIEGRIRVEKLIDELVPKEKPDEESTS